MVAVQRSQQPAVADQLLQPGAQLRLALHAARQAVEVVKQATPDGIHIPFVATGNKGQVALALLQQFEQPVLDADQPVAAALAQGSRSTQGLGAIGVEAAQQTGGIVGHGVHPCCGFSAGRQRHMPFDVFGSAPANGGSTLHTANLQADTRPQVFWRQTLGRSLQESS